jgi:hypothetical protein
VTVWYDWNDFVLPGVLAAAVLAVVVSAGSGSAPLSSPPPPPPGGPDWKWWLRVVAVTAAVTAAAAIAVIYFGGDGPSGSDAATNTAATALADAATNTVAVTTADAATNTAATALADAATNTAIAVVQVAAPVAAGAAVATLTAADFVGTAAVVAPQVVPPVRLPLFVEMVSGRPHTQPDRTLVELLLGHPLLPDGSFARLYLQHLGHRHADSVRSLVLAHGWSSELLVRVARFEVIRVVDAHDALRPSAAPLAPSVGQLLARWWADSLFGVLSHPGVTGAVGPTSRMANLSQVLAYHVISCFTGLTNVLTNLGASTEWAARAAGLISGAFARVILLFGWLNLGTPRWDLSDFLNGQPHGLVHWVRLLRDLIPSVSHSNPHQFNWLARRISQHPDIPALVEFDWYTRNWHRNVVFNLNLPNVSFRATWLVSFIEIFESFHRETPTEQARPRNPPGGRT